MQTTEVSEPNGYAFPEGKPVSTNFRNVSNEEMRAQEDDYKSKADHFADWFTAIIISNSIYLIKFAEKKEEVESLLGEKTFLWYGSFFAASLALILIFLFKVLGVLAAKIRLDKGPCKSEHDLESTREIIFLFYFFLGVLALSFTGSILKIQFF